MWVALAYSELAALAVASASLHILCNESLVSGFPLYYCYCVLGYVINVQSLGDNRGFLLNLGGDLLGLCSLPNLGGRRLGGDLGYLGDGLLGVLSQLEYEGIGYRLGLRT